MQRTRFCAMLLPSLLLFSATGQAQVNCPPGVGCPTGNCPPTFSRTVNSQTILDEDRLVLSPLKDAWGYDLTSSGVNELAAVDRMTQIIEATVRVTISGVCGSGTVVGRDGDGNAIVLTNAHVAGTRYGRVCDLQRWNMDGSGERGRGKIIAAGYSRGMSVDFALLLCDKKFAKNVRPIPLADRYPDQATGVTTFGAPRCEWPSMQVLKMEDAEGQILKWFPEAIGGRSGSSLIDYRDGGPRVVGLLTWGGGGRGLGQSTPFLLDAMRGRMPKAFEQLPVYAREVSSSTPNEMQSPDWYAAVPAVCNTWGDSVQLASLNELDVDAEQGGKTDQQIIDDITGEPEQNPDAEPGQDDGAGIFRDRDKPGPIGRFFEWIRRAMVTVLLMVFAFVAGLAASKLSGWFSGFFRS